MKKLYKSSSDRVIFGVIGGLGEFLNIEPIILRLLYAVLLFIYPPSFFLLYLVASIIIPKDDGVIYNEDNQKNPKDNSMIFMGIGLIVLGSFLLLKMFVPALDIRILPSIKILFKKVFEFWPALLIVLGVYVIFNQRKQK